MRWRRRTAGGARHAVLPENMEESRIVGMCPGDTRWTLPWAMWVDRDRRCWLHPEYPADLNPGGTVSMRIELHPDGYHVWPPADQRYSLQDEPGYVSPADTEYLPVAMLHSHRD